MMALQRMLCTLIVILTNQITKSVSDDARALFRVKVPENESGNQYLGNFCNKSDEIGMNVEFYYIVARTNTKFYNTCGSYGPINDDCEELFVPILDSCDRRRYCDFSKLTSNHLLRGCKLDIYYKCLKEKTNPFRTARPRITSMKTRERILTKKPVSRKRTSSPETVITPGTNEGRKDKGTLDKNSAENPDSNMVSMILPVALAIIAFLVIIIVVLIGLFVCGWSSRFDRWISSRRFREENQQGHITHHVSSPLDEYAYIDQNTLLSDSEVSPTTPSSGQLSNGQARWKTSDRCNRLNLHTISPPSATSTQGDSDDYAVIDDNETAVSPKVVRGKKPSFGVAMPGYADVTNILQPSAATYGNAKDSFENHPGFTQPATTTSKALALLPSPTTESVEYTLPIPRPERAAAVQAKQNQFPDADKEGNSEELRSPGRRSFDRNLSHPGKLVAPHSAFSPSSKPAAATPFPTELANIVERRMSSSRRASLPRHSKLMENNADIDVWVSGCHADKGGHCTSQPSLAKHCTGNTSEPQLYSHLGTHQTVTVLGNVYNG